MCSFNYDDDSLYSPAGDLNDESLLDEEIMGSIKEDEEETEPEEDENFGDPEDSEISEEDDLDDEEIPEIKGEI